MIEQKYKNRYYLNGINIYDRWGIIIERGGYEELTRRAQRKEQYSRNWLDRSGKEVYVGQALYNSRSMTLPFTFLCKDKNDYLEKSKSFFDYLMYGGASGYFNLYVSELKMEFKLLYNSVTSVDDKTALHSEESYGNVVITHNIQLDDNFTEIEYGEKDYSAFISTWDTRNVSTGSSDDSTISLPLRNVNYNLMIDWGDGTPISPILNGNNLTTGENDNEVKYAKLKQLGLTQGDTYNTWSGQGGVIAGKNILNSNLQGVVYIGYDCQSTDRYFRLRVTYIDDSTQDFARNTRGSTNGKEIKDISFLFTTYITVATISNFIISKNNIPYRPSIQDSNNNHVYSKKGIYNITIYGRVSGFSFAGSRDRLKIIDIEQLGDFSISYTGTFSGCARLTLGNTKGVFNKFNSTYLFEMFRASNISNVPLLSLMDVSSCTNMDNCFGTDYTFNGVGLSTWDISSITTAINFMVFNTSMSSNTYDNILKSWSNQGVKRNVVINFGSAKYSEQGEKYRNILINKFNWTITDGGKL